MDGINSNPTTCPKPKALHINLVGMGHVVTPDFNPLQKSNE